MLLPLQNKIRQNFVPAIAGGQLFSDNLRILLLLRTSFGGLNISMFRESSKMEYKNYITITKNLTNLIINQDPIYRVNSAEVSKLKNQMKAQKEVG